MGTTEEALAMLKKLALILVYLRYILLKIKLSFQFILLTLF